jgi:hypothetical protein
VDMPGVAVNESWAAPTSERFERSKAFEMNTDVQNPFECRFCGSPLRHTFVDLGMSPLCQTHIEQDQLDQMEPFYALHVLV